MDKIIHDKKTKWVVLGIEFLIYILLFFYKRVIHFDIISHFLMAVILVFNCYYFTEKTIKKINFTKTQFIFLIIINLAISFFMSGKVLFLTDSVVSLNIVSILFYILANIFVFPFVCNFINFIDNVNIVDKNGRETNSNKFAVKVFFISFICMFIACLAFYPSNITSDTVDQISQAIGDFPIQNAHPAFNTLSIKLLMSIWNNIFVISNM